MSLDMENRGSPHIQTVDVPIWRQYFYALFYVLFAVFTYYLNYLTCPAIMKGAEVEHGKKLERKFGLNKSVETEVA